MITSSLNKIKLEIGRICAEIGRNEKDVTLIAVSKTNPISSIIEAVKTGQIHFAENKAQEFRDKAKLLAEQEIIWHYIGHLQSNKVKYVVPVAEYIHSVDSEKIAAEINKKAEQIGKVQKIFFEVNTSGEESKFGLRSLEQVEELAKFCLKLKNIKLDGLMTMAPFTNDDSVIRNTFRKVKVIFDKLNGSGYSLNHLSMGMTNDFKIAIEEGATLIRIGTAIFGQRDKSLSWRDK